jgi:hypothetical protein
MDELLKNYTFIVILAKYICNSDAKTAQSALTLNLSAIYYLGDIPLQSGRRQNYVI